jgi:transcriptional regulator with XRE-family HTH domain
MRDEKLLIDIALVLKELRESRGVSQQDVYHDTNIHIGRIENCKINPSVSTLSVLSKYFKIKMSEFYSLVEQRKLFMPYDGEKARQ